MILKTESNFNTVINSIHTVIIHCYTYYVLMYTHKGIVCKLNISLVIIVFISHINFVLFHKYSQHEMML